MLFLSYAEEDSEAAAEISIWLRDQNIAVFDWKARRRGGRIVPPIEEAIRKADAFLALLSPSFLSSDWCSREWEMALQREQAIQQDNSDLVFIHVLEILTTPTLEAGFLGGYNWINFTESAGRAAAFIELASRLGPGTEPAPVIAGETSFSLLSPAFRNREDELEKVLRGLTVAGGRHFWLVIAPPQLGKTWFLDQVSAKLTQPETSTSNWTAARVDVRDMPIDVRRDAGALLARFFGRPSPVTAERESLLSIARDISRSGKSRLCLLDSAELLDKKTAATLRGRLNEIYRFVREAGRLGVRLGLVVASRREDEWVGVAPGPRMVPLPLTEFKADVVQEALHDLARTTGRDLPYASMELSRHAAQVYRLTEGLPALLVRCLQWIDTQEWLEMERLESQELFDELTDPYVRQGLLTQESLFPDGRQTGESQTALEQAYRVLAPFRLFTRSHLTHYLESDPAFRAALQDQQWSMEDLWAAISKTALLRRPLNEPWKQIHTAIRRLLHRHYYKSDDQRAGAHSEARKFVEVWADKQSGKEQAIGLIECLWHEAMALRLRPTAEMEQRLCESASLLSKEIRESSAYTPDELRSYAAERMQDDEEFQEAVGDVDGLFLRLVEIVLNPTQES